MRVDMHTQKLKGIIKRKKLSFIANRFEILRIDQINHLGQINKLDQYYSSQKTYYYTKVVKHHLFQMIRLD